MTRGMMTCMAVAILAIGIGCESDKNKHTARADRSDTEMRRVDRSYETPPRTEGAYAYERQTSNQTQRQAASLSGENRWSVEASSGGAQADQQQNLQLNQQGRQRFDANPPGARRQGANQAQPGARARDQASPRQGQGEMRTVELTARDGEFQPSTIRARTGEKLRIALTNAGTKPHNIEFQLPGGEKKMPADVEPSASGQLELTAPNRAGEYRFYCPVADHEQLGMVGKLIVEGPQPVEPRSPGGLNNLNQPGLGNNIGR